ncbi:ModD protein [Blastochloris viridis]|uniref:Putative pyrophosphorylase ModD n=1 Tax=Blastochloris viridis TaxID=1079 RepID=A0A0H5BFL2_BLAVI|nr:ModD protein [Blastochloris viridis]ALK09141.1 putative nicotinate-nucleotide pyrophosphorylase [carboxylating] [Blastochloris viridis]BAS00993.1 molybdenum transport system protein ModD [Blastochloris viridis]CUU41804.1 putative nicotinate-nucleotide pyrophosphorylase[carboxylating] [Blastochloris viridis]
MTISFGDGVLDALIADDVPYGDLTTRLLGIGAQPGRMTFSARGPMVAAAVEDAARLLERAGCAVARTASSGESLAAGAPILTAEAPAAALHRGWKMAQLMVEAASGIATATRAIVEAARAADPNAAVAGTRKAMPGAKALSMAALVAGGAVPHRLGLSETVLVFAEHRAFLGGEPPAETVARLKRGAPEKKIVVEVGSVAEGVDWAAAGADVIQTEKFAFDAVADLAARLKAAELPAIIAAAGGIAAATAGAYVAAGARVIVTSAPYAAKPLDVAVRIVPA